MPYCRCRPRRAAGGNVARRKWRIPRTRSEGWLSGNAPDDGGYGDAFGYGMGASDSTDTLLYRQLHQAAVEAYQAKVGGDKAAEAAARSRMAKIGVAYVQAGHTQDELDYIKAHPFDVPNPKSWLQGLGLGAALVAGGILLLLAKGKLG